MDAFTGEIRLFPFNYAPQDWAYCDGSALSIQQFPALFSILGYTYGGTSGQTFKLPNLNGRAAMGASPQRSIGIPVGADQVTLTPANLTGHTHAVQVKDGTEASAALDVPNSTAYLAQPRNVRVYNNIAPLAGGPTLPTGTLTPAGQLSPGTSPQRSTLQPFLTLSYCICLNGEYPVKPS
jgi:microcystin-dependent protein